ncbi:hypothetical protein GGS23DRAFT_609625 [Durotheca rogersii]|uniref:uncharacterized protein n=1 Tax=Durotheca rogersii TaxID=419775 RepID=UPI00221F47DD|nr:uncharacterized protein GGS23DRAFT_609625 [Durotheca rogersii]KAI5863171.1 hypothetical protein GGS23DRAFT_609625 [Durotheca rogersii]
MSSTAVDSSSADAIAVTVTAISDVPAGEPEGPLTELPPPAPLPLPPAAPQPQPQAKKKALLSPLGAALAAAPSRADAFLAHLQRCLQTPAGIDSTLLFACYASRLGAAVLESAARPAIQRSAERLLALAAALPPSATLVFSAKALPSRGAALALALAARLRALSLALTEGRTFMRLWSLLGLYFWLRRLVAKWRAQRAASRAEKARPAAADDDPVETAISWAQLAACLVFQTLENGAFLSAKGVLGWPAGAQGRAALWGARFWAAFVGLELARLAREASRRARRTRAERFGTGAAAKTAAEVERDEAEWAAGWRRAVARNLAWAPLTLHWGSEAGLLGEMAVASLACVPGVIQIRDLWARTAE